MFRPLLSLALVAFATPVLADPGRPYVYLDGGDAWGPRTFSRDDGYFQGRGGGVEIARGKALYDYDRDYPYDFPVRWGAQSSGYSRVGFMVEHEVDEPRGLSRHCTDEPVRDRSTGAGTTVRICR